MSLVDSYTHSERILEVSSRCHIGYENNWIVAKNTETEQETRMHLDSMLVLMLESEQTTVTTAVLARCSEAGVPIVACRIYRPSGLMLPIASGWNTGTVRRAQTKALRGSMRARRLWQYTIQKKLGAQAKNLDLTGLGMGERIRRMQNDVSKGHPETVEAQAAAIYWRDIFPNFERSNREDPRNHALNWGYAVLMATVARSLTALGCDPTLGFGHSSETNAWALAYDLMEPFRPTIDYVVRKHATHAEELDIGSIKESILGLFANDGPAKKQILRTAQGYRAHVMESATWRIPYPEAPLGT